MTNYRHGQMIHLIGEMDSPLLTVHPDRCLLVRHRNADCLRCAAVCTSGAISLGPEGVVVSPERCIGCGTCASACPTGCLTAANPTDGELFATAEEALCESRGAVAFACERARPGQEDAAPGTRAGVLEDGTPVVAVVCLGRVEEALLVELTARGARNIRLISGQCATCPHHKGGELCNAIVQSTENLLAAMGRPSPLRRERLKSNVPSTTEEHRGAAGCSNRASSAATGSAQWALPQSEDCLSELEYPAAPSGDEPQADARATSASVRTFTHVQPDGTLPHFVPERRLRLFNSLKALGAPANPTVTTRLWGQVSIDTELCRSCRMCTVFCPTGAVSRFDSGDGTFGVEHRSALCMQCRLCETLCPEGAITVADEVSLPEFTSGAKFRFTMQPIGWNPGKEDAIASRMAQFIKVDNVQEPQAKVKSNDTAARRDYAWRREARRREIRGE